jgi:transposase
MSDERGCSFYMAKYTPENKLEAVKSILGDRISFGEAARKYHVDKGDVQKWVAAYQAYGMAGIVKQRISYPGKFKQEVIEDMRANNLSLRETAAKFNLGNPWCSRKLGTHIYGGRH